MNLLGKKDNAHEFLVPYLRETEKIFRSALQKLDSNADCRITPAVDLCVPHDVVRIAGGFATGCLVEWSCSIPVIPIDTTVNIDITSLFITDRSQSSEFSVEKFVELRQLLEEQTIYEWNFHKGNHFIAAVERASDGKSGVFFHSNEKEFKYQHNGLMPVPGNWYWDRVQHYDIDGRYIRLLVGDKAERFYQISRMLHEFTVIRHASIANELLSSGTRILQEKHDFHYYMPNSQSVVIGCYLCDEGDAVPILSKPSYPIDIFSPAAGGPNTIELFTGEKKIVVPHGWGKTSLAPIDAEIRGDQFVMNGITLPIEPKATLGRHPGLALREFDLDPTSPGSLSVLMNAHCPGRVVDRLDQIASFNKDGVVRVG